MARGWLSDLPGIHELRTDGGTPVPTRDTLNLKGAVLLADNPTTGETDLVIAPYSGTSVLSPPQISTAQHDYAPPGWDTADLVRLDVASGVEGPAITGVALAPATIKRKLLMNVGSVTFQLAHDNTSSAAANRFLMPNGSDINLAPLGWADVLYDPVTNRVRVLTYSVGAGG